MSYWIETLTGKAREYIRRQAESDPASVEYWMALDRAVGTLSAHEESIVAVGYEGLRRILAQVGLGEEPEMVLLQLQVAGPDEITAVLNAAAGDLEADTAARKKRIDDLVAMAKELGQEGAKLALTILVGLLAA